MSSEYRTVAEILERDDLSKNRRTIEKCHLHFNGPGASGFGVKRTAMLLPESVMLLVAPSCCGRHGTVTGKKDGFEDRMFYLKITERDLVTGKYLSRIPEAAELISKKNPKPKVIFLSMTCVDAMMGTDLEKIAAEVEEKTGIKTVGSFMDPIAREGRRAPMVSVQTAISSALEPVLEKDEHAVNIIGNFVPLNMRSELYDFLEKKGYKTIRQISSCATYEEYMKMAEGSLNLVINPQAVQAAEQMEKKLGIPYVHMRNTYGPDRIEAELGKIGVYMPEKKERLQQKLDRWKENYGNLSIGIGEAVNGSNMELALTLLEAGINVIYIFKNIVTDYDIEIMKKICEIKPELRIYSGVHPSMNAGGKYPANESPDILHADITIGLDAAYLDMGSISVCWSMENQDFGYSGMEALLDEMEERMKSPLSIKEQIHGSYLTV